MIHTENFVLVDKEKRIRGFYDGTDSEAIKDLMHDIKVLKDEE
jgi:protein SCO1/2